MKKYLKNVTDKLFEIVKTARLHINKELYKKTKYNKLKLLTAKKQAFFDEKLRKCCQTERIVEISWHAQENGSFKLQHNC